MYYGFSYWRPIKQNNLHTFLCGKSPQISWLAHLELPHNWVCSIWSVTVNRWVIFDPWRILFLLMKYYHKHFSIGRDEKEDDIIETRPDTRAILVWSLARTNETAPIMITAFMKFFYSAKHLEWLNMVKTQNGELDPNPASRLSAVSQIRFTSAGWEENPRDTVSNLGVAPHRFLYWVDDQPNMVTKMWFVGHLDNYLPRILPIIKNRCGAITGGFNLKW